MILINSEIRSLIINAPIRFAGDELVNGSSLDVTLGPAIMVESPGTRLTRRATVTAGHPQHFREVNISSRRYTLRPGEFALARTMQVFTLPLNISAEFRLKSTMARLGLNQLLAIWCDPGWENSTLTLELKNENLYHGIQLQHGMRVGQMIFHQHAAISPVASYAKRGKYNNQMAPVAAKERK